MLEPLTRLVERSLVLAEEDGEGHARFRLLETLREYARERLDASSGREAGAVRDRHLAHYLTLAEEAAVRVRQRPRERDDWLRRLDGEHENLRAALAWGVERDPAAGLRLAVALHWFWWYRRRHLEGQRWLETLLAGAPGEGPLQARALFRIGHLLREYGDLERARAALTGALARFAALDDREGQAAVLGSLALLHAAEGRPAEARRCAEQRQAGSREFGAPAEVAIGLNLLGLLAAQEGDFAAASQWYEESSGARPLRGRPLLHHAPALPARRRGSRAGRPSAGPAAVRGGGGPRGAGRSLGVGVAVDLCGRPHRRRGRARPGR